MNLARADEEDTSGWRGELLWDKEHIFQHRREFMLKNPETAEGKPDYMKPEFHDGRLGFDALWGNGKTINLFLK